MSQTETWPTLLEMGFTADTRVMSDIQPGLSIDFGGFQLSASATVSKRFREVVLFTGTHTTARRIAQIEFEAPRSVPSAGFLAAMIAWNIEQHCGADFRPAAPVTWFDAGRQNYHLLPWVKAATDTETKKPSP